jgi:hypothetical protein
MKIFVGWPYDAEWVEKYAIPLIKTYAVTVDTGKEMAGQRIQEGIMQKIQGADAAVFFTTRRGQDPGNANAWKTSDWVVEEITYAKSLQKELILDMREEGVEYPNKLFEERQHIIMDPNDRLQSLVKLGEAISQWRRLTIRLKLLPDDFIKALRQRFLRNDYTCTYSISRRGNTIYGPKSVKIYLEDKGFFIYAHDLPAEFFNFPDAFIELSIDIGDRWYAYGIPLTSLDVTLEKA